MADFPTPERVRQMAEIRAYALAIDLDPNKIIEILTEDNPPYAPKMHFVFADGSSTTHDGFHALTEEQRAAVTAAGDEIARLWAQLDKMPAFHPRRPRLDE